MKRLSILFTLLLTLSIILTTGCDNGSAPESSSSSLVKVSFTVDGDSYALQKVSSLEGFVFTYQYKAIPQWTSDENIYGETDNWTSINYFDGMSLGYFTPGKWVFYIQILNGNTVVYEGHSDVIAISRSSADITISVARIIKETTPGLSISITAPTENSDALTISWGGGSDSANVSRSGGITTFTYSKDNLADGTYTITLTHSNNQIAPYVISDVSINSTDLTLIRGHLNNGEWNVTCETLQFHDVTVERYNWNDEEHPWATAQDPKYCGTVDYISSAVPGERVSFSPRPEANSRVISVSVICGNTEVDFIKQGTLYLFIMPEGDVTIRVKFSDVDSAEVDATLFRTIVRALYSENELTVETFGKFDEVNDDPPGGAATTLGDVTIWYSSGSNKICWKADNANGKAYLTDGSIAGLFSGGNKYQSISMDDIVTKNVTDMSRMFQGCTSLTSLNLTNFNASSASDISEMFQGCTGLTSLIITGFTANTASRVNMAGLFKDCSGLTTLTGFSSINTSKAISLASMFQGCTGLTGTLNLTNFNASSATDISYMFQGCTGLSKITLTGFTANTTSGVNMAGLFKDCSSLTTLTGLSSINTSKATSLASLFQGCTGLKNTLDLTNFNASSATDISYMFQGCTGLSKITLTGFTLNTTSGVNMAGMFKDCTNLYGVNGILDLSSFDTTQATDMSYMFCACKKLKGINFGSNFHTANVTDMSYMFSSVESGTAGGSSNKMKLESLDVSGFDTSSVTNMSHMFYMCSNSNLTTLAVSGFDTSNVTDMSYMFGCWRDAPSYVTAFDLSGWDFSKVTTVNRMFDRCQFAVITFPSHTMLPKIEDVLYWFSHCFAVHRSDFATIVGSWDFTGNAGAAALFADTTNGDDSPEREPSNRIMGSDMATSSDFGTRQGYSTYSDPNDPKVNNPVTTLYVGGDMSKIKNQRLTTVISP